MAGQEETTSIHRFVVRNTGPHNVRTRFTASFSRQSCSPYRFVKIRSSSFKPPYFRSPCPPAQRNTQPAQGSMKDGRTTGVVGLGQGPSAKRGAGETEARGQKNAGSQSGRHGCVTARAAAARTQVEMMVWLTPATKEGEGRGQQRQPRKDKKRENATNLQRHRGRSKAPHAQRDCRAQGTGQQRT